MKNRRYIPLSECKHGYLYRLSSRNLTFGVFDKPVSGFIGIRFKFEEFLTTEYHYELDESGTVYPLIELEELPKDIKISEDVVIDGDYRENMALFDWLKIKEIDINKLESYKETGNSS